MSGRLNYHAGQSAEQSVAMVYEREGMQVVARRWRGQGGEIDLIVSQGDGYRFVEVKKAASHSAAAQRLSPSQMRRIMTAAVEFCAALSPNHDVYMGFDLATMDQAGSIEIRRDAFCDQ